MDCCIPNFERIGDEVSVSSREGTPTTDSQGGVATDMVRLEGEFLMGTRARERNRRDGEDPVRRITVSPFSICDDDGHEPSVRRVRGGERDT